MGLWLLKLATPLERQKRPEKEARDVRANSQLARAVNRQLKIRKTQQLAGVTAADVGTAAAVAGDAVGASNGAEGAVE